MGIKRTTKEARGEKRQEEGRDKEPKQNIGRKKVFGFRCSCFCPVLSGHPV